jgi:hypothetical protein
MCLRTGCCGKCLEMKATKYKEAGGNCIGLMVDFMICAVRHVLLG